eukprot:365535-Chlamydomonas_euryale.AAC.70
MLSISPCHLQGSAPTRRRMPRWLALMRMQQQQAQRNAHAAFRCWATVRTGPQMDDPTALPLPLRALHAELLALAMHRYRSVRDRATRVVMDVTKRLSALTRASAAAALAGIGDVPPPDTAALLALTAGGDWRTEQAAAEVALFTRLQTAAVAGRAGDASGSAAPADAAAGPGGAAAAAETDAASSAGGSGGGSDSDTDRDARCRGAALLLHSSLPLLRVVFRDVAFFSGLLHAVLASRAYNTTPLQSDLGVLVLSLLDRFVRPPALDPDGPEQTQLSASLLSVARPGNGSGGGAGGSKGGMTWRYVMLANVLAVLLMPAPGHAAGDVVLAHLLELLGSCEAQELRALALLGVYVQCGLVVEHGVVPYDGMVARLRAWLGDAAHAAALARHLSSAHSRLEQRDAARAGAGGGGGGGGRLPMQLLRGGFEEMLTYKPQLAAVMMAVWPLEDGVAAVEEGLFVTTHARAIQMLGRLAPTQLAAGLRPVLEEMATPERVVQVWGASRRTTIGRPGLAGMHAI